MWARAGPRREVERLIAEEYRGSERWTHFGWCDACEKPCRFECDWLHSTDGTPNFRERLVCEECRLNCRERFVLRSVREVPSDTIGAPRRRLYAYEQETPLYRALEQCLPEATVEGADYLGQDVEPGTFHDGVRHDGALPLTFPDETFDVAISNDVYDRVPDVGRALRETARILRPGGVMFATFPFHFTPSSSQRAERENHLGWDLLETCKTVGFVEPHFRCIHSFQHAYLGVELGLLLCAHKK